MNADALIRSSVDDWFLFKRSTYSFILIKLKSLKKTERSFLIKLKNLNKTEEYIYWNTVKYIHFLILYIFSDLKTTLREE